MGPFSILLFDLAIAGYLPEEKRGESNLLDVSEEMVAKCI